MKENRNDVEKAFREFNVTINFALDVAERDVYGIMFLRLWREGERDVIARDFPKFKGSLPTN